MPRPYKTPKGHFGPGRRMWVKVTYLEAVIYDDPTEDDEESVRLLLIRGAKVLPLYLTDFTVPELVAVKKVIDAAFEAATPIAQARDDEAKEALANGDDSNTRTYRPLPHLVDRSGQERRNDARVRVRSARVPDDDVAGDGPDVRPEGGTMAEREPEVMGTQDHGPETDGAEIVRPADEVAH